MEIRKRDGIPVVFHVPVGRDAPRFQICRTWWNRNRSGFSAVIGRVSDGIAIRPQIQGIIDVLLIGKLKLHTPRTIENGGRPPAWTSVGSWPFCLYLKRHTYLCLAAAQNKGRQISQKNCCSYLVSPCYSSRYSVWNLGWPTIFWDFYLDPNWLIYNTATCLKIILGNDYILFSINWFILFSIN